LGADARVGAWCEREVKEECGCALGGIDCWGGTYGKGREGA